jgi:hypothetical protein
MGLRLRTRQVITDPVDRQIEEWWQALLNIEGIFTVEVSEGLLLEETHWCIVELASELKKWLPDGQLGNEFVYTSMDEEKEGLLWFRPVSPDKWQIGSAWEVFPCMETFCTSILISACREYIAQVEAEVRTVLGLELTSRFLEYGAPHKVE